jgi:hypothetical protein
MQCSPASSYGEVQHVNPIDRSFGIVFARWRGLGILALARLVWKGRHTEDSQLILSGRADDPKSRSLAGKIQK